MKLCFYVPVIQEETHYELGIGVSIWTREDLKRIARPAREDFVRKQRVTPKRMEVL